MLDEYFIGSKEPKCRLHDCFANKNGYCVCLTDNHFNKPCPFFKKNKESKK